MEKKRNGTKRVEQRFDIDYIAGYSVESADISLLAVSIKDVQFAVSIKTLHW